MLYRRMLLAAPAALLAARSGWAEEAEAGADQPAAVAGAALTSAPDLGSIEDRMDAWIDSSGFGTRADRNELKILKGVSTVQVIATNPDWVRFRQLAYTDALLQAQSEFVAEQNTRIMTKTVSNFFKSADEQPPPYVNTRTPGQSAELLRKLLAVVSGKLDHELQELGIDPKEYASAPEAQRTTLLSNHLKISTISQSIGDTIGLCPVMTLEDIEAGTGKTKIGVIAVVSAKMRDFAQQVLIRRGAFEPDASHSADPRKLLAVKSKLVSDFGVRRMYDLQGLPVIVSFAQWASPYKGTDPVMAENYVSAARRQAESIAEEQLATFLKGSISYDRNGTAGQEIDRIAVSLPDNASIEDTKKIVDEVRKAMVRTAVVTITGQRNLGTWSARHPKVDREIVGVVRMWSAAGEQAIRAEQVPKRAAAVEKPPASGNLEGRKLMDANDF
jgi:hypothetical protein